MQHTATVPADRAFPSSGGDTLAVAIEMSPLTYNFAHGDSAAGFDYEIISDFAADRGIPVTFSVP